MIEGEPKTAGSKRWVTLPPSVALTLAGHVGKRRDGLVFPGPGGGPLYRKTFPAGLDGRHEGGWRPGFPVRNLRHCGAMWGARGRREPDPGAFRLGHRTLG